MLLLECGDDGHHRFHTPGALRTLGPTAALTPEHPRTDRSLCRVVAFPVKRSNFGR
jgi:hypothetical protein